nr:redox-regulated ATPase YchF [Desulfobacterales bacterium]
MRLGIIGLPGSGKTTIFQTLTHDRGEKTEIEKMGLRVAVVRVPDSRLEILSKLYRPQKTIYAQLEYVLPLVKASHGREEKAKEESWGPIRDCDALIHVVRNFQGPGGYLPDPQADLVKLESELIFSDLVSVEKRLERLEADRKRGKRINEEELSLLNLCLKLLEGEIPLRKDPDLAASPLLKGYSFLSAKPILVLFNNADEDDELPRGIESWAKENGLVVRGKLEMELTQLEEGADEFLKEYGIRTSAVERIIRRSYDILGLISFFTVGDNEVRSWSIKRGSTVLEAADMIHSDFKKGFIRAEVVSFTDLVECGSYHQARKGGKIRMQGKNYHVQDGDVIRIHFKV